MKDTTALNIAKSNDASMVKVSPTNPVNSSPDVHVDVLEPAGWAQVEEASCIVDRVPSEPDEPNSESSTLPDLVNTDHPDEDEPLQPDMDQVDPQPDESDESDSESDDDQISPVGEESGHDRAKRELNKATRELEKYQKKARNILDDEDEVSFIVIKL